VRVFRTKITPHEPESFTLTIYDWAAITTNHTACQTKLKRLPQADRLAGLSQFYQIETIAQMKRFTWPPNAFFKMAEACG
jgi:hypothetical protein